MDQDTTTPQLPDNVSPPDTTGAQTQEPVTAATSSSKVAETGKKDNKKKSTDPDPCPPIPFDGNELSSNEKNIAGILLIAFILLPIYFIIAFWPDQTGTLKPDGKGPEIAPFVYKLFDNKGNNMEFRLLYLVALAGFLGNMIHIANSFIAFTGAGQFKRKWILFYCVTPFIGSALALILYFALQSTLVDLKIGTFNPYMIMAMAALAGMFTDKTTMKLKDILDTIISPKDTRTDKLTAAPGETAIKITDINPQKLIPGKENSIVITGSALTSKKLVIKINEAAITNAVITDTSITIPYTIESASPPLTEFNLAIADDKGTALYNFKLGVQ